MKESLSPVAVAGRGLDSLDSTGIAKRRLTKANTKLPMVRSCQGEYVLQAVSIRWVVECVCLLCVVSAPPCPLGSWPRRAGTHVREKKNGRANSLAILWRSTCQHATPFINTGVQKEKEEIGPKRHQCGPRRARYAT